MQISSIQISNHEFRHRITVLLEYIIEKEYTGAVLFDNNYILYYTGFAFFPTERPIAFALNSRGETSLLVPRLELEHAQSNALTDRVVHYLEYPYDTHPMIALKALMADMGISPPYGADHDGYLQIYGYRGPSLSELLGKPPHQVSFFIEEQMMIKSPEEQALIRESVKWGNLAHTLLQRYTRAGLTENEVSLRASNEATLRMMDAIGPIYKSLNPYSDGAGAGYRGQIGRGAAIPHSLANNIVFQPGDILVTGAGAPVWGYNSELERTMVLGKPNEAQIRMFGHMLALQETAFELLKPGRQCCDIDHAVTDYYKKHNLVDYWKHHTGHSIGLREHESPFLDLGDKTEIKPGMVFTVEPGLYIPNLGGFRHSDTVLITKDGNEILTYYPRDLESLTIPE